MSAPRRCRWDFFVSYTSADQRWAEWIAWQLESAGHQVLLQAWDMVPGSNWTATMQGGVHGAERTVAVVSAAYLDSVYGAAEWQSAWRMDPQGSARKLIPVRVEDCPLPGLLASIVSVDLYGLSAEDARSRLVAAVDNARRGYTRPATEPPFPLAGELQPPRGPRPPASPSFPGPVVEPDDLMPTIERQLPAPPPAEPEVELRGIVGQAAPTSEVNARSAGRHPENLDFEGGQRPDGRPNAWGGGGSGYALGVDTENPRTGTASGRIRSTVDGGSNLDFGTMTQCIDPGDFRGKRVRYSGYLRTIDVAGWAGLWMRVDGPSGRVASFDNMRDRAVLGSTSWTRYEIILDVYDNAESICFGFLLTGPGTICADGLQFEILAPAGTGPRPTSEQHRRLAPLNLDFAAGVDGRGVPRHWGGAGAGYRLILDPQLARHGKDSACIRSIGLPGREGFGTLTQCFAPDEFWDKRVRYSGHLRNTGRSRLSRPMDACR